jgi:hypothetical protein
MRFTTLMSALTLAAAAFAYEIPAECNCSGPGCQYGIPGQDITYLGRSFLAKDGSNKGCSGDVASTVNTTLLNRASSITLTLSIIMKLEFTFKWMSALLGLRYRSLEGESDSLSHGEHPTVQGLVGSSHYQSCWPQRHIRRIFDPVWGRFSQRHTLL